MAQALQRTVDPPGWCYNVRSLQNLMQGNSAQAVEGDETAASKMRHFAWFLVAMASSMLSEAGKASAALEMLSKTETRALIQRVSCGVIARSEIS